MSQQRHDPAPSSELTGVVALGLGPGAPEHLTIEAWQILQACDEIYLRTRRHPTVAHLPKHLHVHSFDDIYEQAKTIDAVYEGIAQRVLELGRRPQGVVYAVPGHPRVGETSVRRILELARAEGVPVRIVSGISFVEPSVLLLNIDPLDGLQIGDAMELARRYHPSLDPDTPALIGQLYSREVAGDVKLTLMSLYPDDHPVTLVHAAGTPDEEVRTVPLYDLDRQDDIAHLTSLYIPPLPEPGSLHSFQDIVARLRGPDGCPWDREQTHQSLRTHLLEEAYEVLAALDANDAKALSEELGDLLLQILLHAQIATEEGEFRVPDVVRQIVAKLIRRHPHVFANRKVADSQEVLRNWEQIKREEKADGFVSMLAGVTKTLPSLSQAQELQRRAARVGFDWPGVDGVLEKVSEELKELAEAPDPDSVAAELGDLLFSLVNLARWLEIDAESALREASRRFAQRFRQMEMRAADQGKHMEDLPLEELDALWEEAKKE